MLEIFDQYQLLFIKNEFFDKYVKLCEQNLTTQKQKFKTQQHHIVPRSYFRQNNLQVDNSINNLINLTHADHILAHYYLCKCVIEEFVYHNEYALFYMIGKFSDEVIDFDFIVDKQQIYEDFCQRQSVLHTGKHPWNYGKSYSDEMRQKLSEAHKGKKQSMETILLRSSLMIGKNSGGVYVNNGTISKHIRKEELQTYLDDGWVIGSIQIKTVDFSDRVTITDGVNEKRVPKSELDNYLTNNWKLGRKPSALSNIKDKKARQHISTCSGRIWVTNGIVKKRVTKDQIQDYLNQGFWKGAK